MAIRMPQPGELKDRITFQTPTAGEPDSIGQPTIAWSDYTTVWAKVEGITGTERYIAPELVAVASHKVQCRYLSGITPNMRIMLADARILEIVSITNPDNGSTQLFIACKESV